MNAIRAWLDMDKELAKHLHKTLKKVDMISSLKSIE